MLTIDGCFPVDDTNVTALLTSGSGGTQALTDWQTFATTRATLRIPETVPAGKYVLSLTVGDSTGAGNSTRLKVL